MQRGRINKFGVFLRVMRSCSLALDESYAALSYGVQDMKTDLFGTCKGDIATHSIGYFSLESNLMAGAYQSSSWCLGMPRLKRLRICTVHCRLRFRMIDFVYDLIDQGLWQG